MSLSNTNRCRGLLVCSRWLLVVGLLTSWVHDGAGQQATHNLFNSQMPTGEIGQHQLRRRPALRGFSQPVQVKLPESAEVSVAEGTGFSTPSSGLALFGLQVGEVYRLKVDRIPNRTGTVYPSIELLDRMHPPRGKETRYPIPIEISLDDLRLALAGKFVTRVVYVEDPRDALPARELPDQRYFEVLPEEDPLIIAGELGRPVAILRLGSVAPGSSGMTSDFLFGSPPVVHHATADNSTSQGALEASSTTPADQTPLNTQTQPFVPQGSGSIDSILAPARKQDSSPLLPDDTADPFLGK